MADPLDSQNIARRPFEVGRRGYEQQQVRAFLHEVSSLVERLQRESAEVRERAERAETRLGLASEPDETMLLEVLGEETTRVLTSAREAAAEIRAKAEAAAERVIQEATFEAAETRAGGVKEADRRLAAAATESESILAAARTEMDRRSAEAEEAAARIREDAATQARALRDEGQHELDRLRESAASELEVARTRGREMVAEAQAVRERVLRDLAIRRKKARQQVEKLNAGRERLLQAYEVVRRTIDEATNELSTSLSDARLAADAAARRIEDEPDPTLEELDEEVATAGLVDLPIADHDEPDDPSPGPFSGEVPVVAMSDAEGAAVEPDAVVPDVEDSPVDEPPPPTDLEARRGRKGRRRKGEFAGLPAGSLVPVEQPTEGEGVRILEDPAAAVDIEEPTPAEDAPDPVEPATQDADVATEEAGSEAEPGDPPAASDTPASDEVPAADAADDGPTEDEDPVPPSADDVFARLRAENEGDENDESEPTAEADAAADDASEATAEAAEPAPADAEPTPFTERDAALEPVDKELGRRLKRALADEQNEVLDLLRRAKPTGVDDLLPTADAHAGRWAEVVAAALADAATAGAAWSGGKAGASTDLADDLARSLTAPLRDRIDRSFAASDGNLDDVADRVRALYREWKGQRLIETSRHYVAAAYARGVYDSLAKGAEVRWVVDPQGGPCPDCDDNVLGGALAKGTEFPTGHTCAPAHPGCRCLVLPTQP